MMKQFRGFSNNVFFVERDDGKLTARVECVFIYSEPAYSIDSDADIIRQGLVGDFRIVFGAKSLRAAATSLAALAAEAERQEKALEDAAIPDPPEGERADS
jgi:hypothetical protein